MRSSTTAGTGAGVISSLRLIAVSRLVAKMSRWAIEARQRRRNRLTCRVLESLDDRTLADIGIERAEIISVVSQLAGYRLPDAKRY